MLASVYSNPIVHTAWSIPKIIIQCSQGMFMVVSLVKTKIHGALWIFFKLLWGWLLKGKTLWIAQGQACRWNQKNSWEVPWVPASDLRLWQTAKKVGCCLARLSFFSCGRNQELLQSFLMLLTWMSGEASKIKPFFGMHVPKATTPFSALQLPAGLLGWKYVLLPWFSKLVLVLRNEARRFLFCHSVFVSLT